MHTAVESIGYYVHFLDLFAMLTSQLVACHGTLFIEAQLAMRSEDPEREGNLGPDTEV